jgi:hypothetical protein
MLGLAETRRRHPSVKKEKTNYITVVVNELKECFLT